MSLLVIAFKQSVPTIMKIKRKIYIKVTPFIPMQVVEQLLKGASLHSYIIYREIITFFSIF